MKINKNGNVVKFKRKINYAELHPIALALISDEQMSYIDEFSFFVYPSRTCGDEKYEAWYAGELLVIWNGSGWFSPKE